MSYPQNTPSAGTAASKGRRSYYHVAVIETPNHIETLCGRRISRRTGVVGTAAKVDREPCSKCASVHQLNQDMKRSMSDQTALILGALELIGRSNDGVDQ